MGYSWDVIDEKLEELIEDGLFLKDSVNRHRNTNCRYCMLYYPFLSPSGDPDFNNCQYLHLIEFHRSQAVNQAIYALSRDYKVAFAA